MTGAPSGRHVGAIILAAGSSSRMGEPKQLLTLDGQPLLVRVVETVLASSAWPVVVVLGANAPALRPLLVRQPVLVAENSAWMEGMASSLRTGIATLQQFSRRIDAAVVTLCDQPALKTAHLVQLIEVHRATGHDIVAARYNGRNGAPALFSRKHFPALSLLTGEEGARSLLNSPSTPVHPLDLPELAVDLDTPADYAAFKNSGAV
jgi:CTP:molybdopterin cytidylyltransferase MocA